MYAYTENNQVIDYPLSELEIRERFPNTSFPADFAANLPEGYRRVYPAAKPDNTELTIITETTPMLVDGILVQAWIQTDRYTAEEISKIEAEKEALAWVNLRNQRDGLIKESNWIIERHRDQKELGVPTTITDGQYLAWLHYRQELRDLPENVVDINNVTVPASPDKFGVV